MSFSKKVTFLKKKTKKSLIFKGLSIFSKNTANQNEKTKKNSKISQKSILQMSHPKQKCNPVVEVVQTVGHPQPFSQIF